MISSAFYYDKTDFLNLCCNWCSYKASVKPFISHFAVSIKSQEPQQQSFLILDKCNPDGHGLKGRAALTRVNKEDDVDFWWEDRNKRWTPSCTACSSGTTIIFLCVVSRYIYLPRQVVGSEQHRAHWDLQSSRNRPFSPAAWAACSPNSHNMIEVLL